MSELQTSEVSELRADFGAKRAGIVRRIIKEISERTTINHKNFGDFAMQISGRFAISKVAKHA